MSDLTEWLLACIAEDEGVARAARALQDHGEDRWWVDGPAEKSRKWWVYSTGEKFHHEATAAHIARNDPAHVLAVCKAHRAIVEAYGATRQSARRDAPPHGLGWNQWDGHSITVDGETLHGPAATELISHWYEDCPPEPAIRALATIYADRPGWREEWAS